MKLHATKRRSMT